MAVQGIDLGKYQLGWSDSTEDYVYTPKKGLNTDIIREISHRRASRTDDDVPKAGAVASAVTALSLSSTRSLASASTWAVSTGLRKPTSTGADLFARRDGLGSYRYLDSALFPQAASCRRRLCSGADGIRDNRRVAVGVVTTT